MPEDGSLRVFLLGRFEVERDGQLIAREAWKRRRPVELLSQLALAPSFVLHREEIIDRLWPEKDLDAGANNLYRTLHELRRIAGPDVACLERGAVRLGDRVWVDVNAFEKAASSGTMAGLEEAMALYRGDLLPDDPYSDALLAKRQSLRQRFVDVASRLSRHHEDGEHRDAAVDVLRRLLAVDDTLEEAHRRLMTALATAGRRKEAMKQYAECVQALRRQLDTEPSAATHELKRRIESGEVGSSESPIATVGEAPLGWKHVAQRLLGTEKPRPIRGRADELRAVAGLAAADSGVLVITGEAGFGKTRHAVECARLAGERGDTLLVGLGYEFEGTAPYTPFVDAYTNQLRMQGRPLSDNPFIAFVPTAGASAQEDRIRLFDMVERSLVQLAGKRSVTLIIEDLHHADESSLLLLYHLARASRHLPIKLVGTARNESVRIGTPLHTLLAGLGRERLVTSVTLGRLSIAATRELIGDLCGEAPGDDLVAEVYRLCAGHPFYTEEVIDRLREHGLDQRPTVSDDLVRTIASRVATLGGDTERLLLAAAVYGVRFDFDVAASAAGLDSTTALDALDVGLASRLVEEHDGQYCFRHALTREALCGSLSHARRVFLHRAVAEAVETRADTNDPPSEMLAHLHQVAGQLERALPHLLFAAARARARLGFGEAVSFCERAVEVMDAMGMVSCPERFESLLSMGGMRVALGDLDGALEALDAAAALGEARGGWRPAPKQRASALRLAGLAMIEAGQLDAAESRLGAALAILTEIPESDELSDLYYLLSQLRWHQHRHAEAFELAERCLVEAERIDDVQAVAKGYEMLALACHSLGDWKQGTDYEQRRSSLADGTLDVASAFDVHL